MRVQSEVKAWANMWAVIEGQEGESKGGGLLVERLCEMVVSAESFGRRRGFKCLLTTKAKRCKSWSH